MAVILGTVAHWSFDGDSVIDDEGGIPGILNGNAAFTAVGETDSGVTFDGNGDTFQVNHDPSLALANGSFSVWINPTSTSNRQGILSKDSRGYGDGGHIGVMLEAGGVIRFRMQSTNGTFEVLSNVSVVAGEWANITVSWGADGMQLFIDGVLAGTGTYTGGIEANQEPLLLGANQWGSQVLSTVGANDFFTGSIDGFGVYDHQLTAGEIADVMEGVVLPNEAPTLEAAILDQTATEESAFAFDVPAGTFADADGNVLTLTATLADGSALPSWLTFDGASFAGTPDDPDVGAIDITVVASDGRETAETTFTLTVDAVNDAPVATDDAVGLDGATTADIDLLANDTDVDSPALSITAIDGVGITAGQALTLTSGATVTLNANGTVTYGNGTGANDAFTYTVSDGAGASDQGNVTISATSPPPPPPPPPSTAVAEFNFEEGAGTTSTDAAGGLQAIFNGAAAFIADGQTGFGVDLTGGNSTVEVAHDASMALTDGSFSLWINPDSVNTRQGVLSKDSYGYGDGGHIGVMIERGGVIRFRMQDANKGTYEVYSTVSIAAGEWSHITVSWGADGMQLFIDGELAGTGTYTGGIENNQEPLLLGANQWGSQALSTVGANDFFSGSVDGFGVYDHQLSASEIADVMTGVVTPNEAPTLEAAIVDQTGAEEAAFSFDVPAGTFADADGNALTLTATLADGSALPSWLSFNGATFSGVPDDADVGAIDVKVIASDGRATADTTFTLTITPVNDAPVVVDDTLGLNGQTTGVIDLLANDTDVDSTTLTVTEINGTSIATGQTVTLTSGATVTLNANGTITYGNGSGADDAFTYAVSDGDGGSNVGNVEILAELLPPPPPPPPPATGDAVAYFSFEEGAGTTTLDGQTGKQALLNGTASFITNGQNGYGIDLSGNSDTVEIAHDSSLALANGSFAIWINPDATTSRQGILSKDSRGYGDGGHIGLMLEAGGVLRYRMQSTNGTNEVYTTTSVSANQWSLVVVTWGADGMQIFVNGELAGTGTYTGGIENNEEPLLLGANQWGSNNLSTVGANDFYNGQIDGFGVYDHQLTSAEVLGLMDGSTPTGDNRAPVVSSTLDDLAIQVGEQISIDLPGNLFTDPDGDALTITATLANGAALPSWLQFDGQTFTGVAPNTASGALDLLITATDGELQTSVAATAVIADGLTLSFAGSNVSHAVDLEALVEGTPLKIMAIGDSITVGTRSNVADTNQGALGGYRDDLFNRFAKGGVLIDYVGDYTGAPAGSGMLDGAHQGVGGRKAARVAQDLTTKANQHDADIILLLVGTNDATYDNNAALTNYPNQVTQMIATLFASRPDVQLFIGTIPPVQPNETISGSNGAAHQAIIDTLNNWLRSYVSQLQAGGNTNIHLVDIAAAMDPSDISPTSVDSGVHPTEDGYGVMAEAWYQAIASVFNIDSPTLDDNVNDVAWNTVNLVGGNAMDMLLGNAFDNMIDGGAGNDWLDGRAGDDVLTGGAGNDVFVMSTGDDLITDFSATNDILDVSGHDIQTLAEFLANSVQVGSSLVFTDPVTGDTITLEDTTASEMTDTNILYTGEYSGADDLLIG